MIQKSFLQRGTKNEQMALQITSMADIFVIILVFLLKSYSIQGLPYEPTLPLNPPVAKGRLENRESLKLEVSKKALSLGGESVVSMKDFRFSARDLDREGTSVSLKRALAKLHARNPKENRLMVVADQGSPYETIKAVLASAASEGFLDIQLAVSNAN
jgi:biopolymer transport protein ExbD